MMSKTTFKLTFIAASLLAAQSASAAIYNVVEVTPKITANQYYGSAIESKEIDVTTDPKDPTQLGCFGTNQCDETDYVLAGDTRNGTEGIPYKDEVPFKVDNTFTYLDRDDLKRYCYNQLGYDTCEGWADDQWYGGGNKLAGGLERERDAFRLDDYKSNASAFDSSGLLTAPIKADHIPSDGAAIVGTANTVITNLVDGATPIGITSSGYFDVNGHYALAFRQRGFFGGSQLLPSQDNTQPFVVKQMGRTFAYDSFAYDDGTGSKTYVVGSASIAPFDTDDKNYYGDISKCTTSTDPASLSNCQNFAFATQAYYWDVTSTTPDAAVEGDAVSGWVGQATTSPNHKKAAAQGSARTAAVSDVAAFNGLPVLAGFNTRRDKDNFLMEAAIFYPTKSAGFSVGDNAWSSVFINGARVKDGSDYIYSNSLVKAMNRNLIAIGETKRSGRYSDSGAANNRLFYTDAATGSASKSPNAVYLSGGIFFSGAGGEANDINNFNEVVGSIDAEKDRETDGKQRRRRGFIDPLPLSLEGTNPERLAIFQGKSWWLDNLTNGDNAYPKNNQYRIINATGINDDGVISATAIKCEGGYDNTTHNSYCGDGNSKEKVVAVKLVPIAGTTSADITARSGDNPKVERAGSLGVWVLGLLGFIGFRRKSSLKK